MRARDFRAQARDALRGRWLKTAALVLLATLLGGGTVYQNSFSGVNFNFGLEQANMSQEMMMVAIIFMVLGLASVAFSLFLGGFVRVGMVRLMNNMLDGEEPHAGTLFCKGIYWKTVKMNLLRGIYVFLWSMLFVIPGIIAIYRYAMADYLLLKHPEMTANELLAESKKCMHGRKWRMFCLEFSFIGWAWLCLLLLFAIVYAVAMSMVNTAEREIAIMAIIAAYAVGGLLSGIGGLFLRSYMNAAAVAFFREAERSARWQDEAREGAQYAEAGFTQEENVQAEEGSAAVFTADEAAARDMFLAYGCSRRAMHQEGVLEDYDALKASPISQERWKRDYADGLMRRFDHDAHALDDILVLSGEYAMGDLLDRALSRIERHIRHASLADEEILNMCGCVLALLVSGVFEDDAGFVRRKKEQISDMADRLEHRLKENGAEGEWIRALEMIRSMCA